MTQHNKMKTYYGNCHCGDIQFSLRSSLDVFTTCDCSLCSMRGVLMVKVPQSDLRILAGQGQLRLYQWNMKIAKHYFCKRCGVYVFHNKRAVPDYYGVNITCLDGVSDTDAPHLATKGDDMTLKSSTAKAHWPGPHID